MKELYKLKMPGRVDFYYNDLYALEKSISELKNLINKMKKSEEDFFN